MMSYMTEARPYANALFEIALLEQTTAPWLEALQVLGVAALDDDFNVIIDSLGKSKDELRAFFLDLVKTLLPKVYKGLANKLENFLSLLIDNKRVQALSAIHQQFAELEAKHQNMIKVTVCSATSLTEDQCTKMQAKLEKRFNTKVQANYVLDPDLIGGAVIHAGNWVMDGSIKGKIARLNEGLLT